MDVLMLDTEDRNQQETIDKGGIKIPKLDLTSIYLQREVVSSNNDNSNEEGSDDEEDADSYYEEGTG